MVNTRSRKRELLPELRHEIVKTRSRKRKLPELPHEIIVDILSRLPCKSLVKFRHVSKQWNSLISSRQFTWLHFSRSAIDTSRQRILLRPQPFHFIRWDDLDKFSGSGLDVVVKEDTPRVIPDACTYIDLVGECNGLFCIAMRIHRQWSSRSFLLWNPATRDSKEVRKVDVTSDVDQSCMFDFVFDPERFEMYGFGYDSSCDDYKIVSVVGHVAKPTALIIEICRVGSRKWRKVKLPSSGIICVTSHLFKRGSFLNGALHWPMKKIPSDDNVILSFDLGKADVKELTLLPYLSKIEFVEELRVLDGKLVLTNMVNNNEMEIWVMNEYGVGLSFTKKVTLYEMPESTSERRVIPVCISGDGSVLVYDGMRLMMYDPEKKTYKVIIARGCHRYISAYAESLISPYHIPNTKTVTEMLKAKSCMYVG